MSSKFLITWLFLCLLFSNYVLAEETEDAAGVVPATGENAAAGESGAAKEKDPDEGKSEAAVLDEVVVSASRSEETPFNSERSLDVVTGDEISRMLPRTAPEALRESPGVFVQQTNMGGGSPIIRGMVGPQILILHDGIRLNNSVFRTGPLQYLNLIDQYQISRLEVVRGPGSVLYGSDAVGGVINAYTIDPLDRRGNGFGAGGRGVLKYGSAAQEKTVHALLDTGYDFFGMNASATFKDFENLEGGRGVGAQPHSSYNQINAMGKLAFRLKEGFVQDWSFNVGYRMARMNDVGRAEKLQTRHSYDIYQNDHDLVYGRAHMIFRPINTSCDITLSYQKFKEDKENIRLDETHSIELKNTLDKVGVDTVGFDTQFNTDLFEKRFNLVYGVELYQDWVDSSRKEHGTSWLWTDSQYTPYPEGSLYRNLGAYLKADGELLPLEWNWHLRLTAGYRMQQMLAHADARQDIDAIDFDHLAHTGMAGIQTSYRNNWMAAFTWSQGFRAPNLNEAILIGDTGEFYHIDNPDLGPEKSDELEFLTRFKAWRLSGSAAAYVNFIKDYIKRIPTTFNGQSEIVGRTVAQNVNVGDGLIYGFEGTIGADLSHGLSSSFALTYTWGESEELDGTTYPISKIPPLFGDWRLRWEGKATKKVDVFAETYILFATKQSRLSEEDKKDVRIPEGGTPGWATWNARAGVDLYEHYRIGLALENLTDNKYKYHASGVYSAGTNAVLSLEADF